MQQHELFFSDHLIFFLIGILIPFITLYKGKPDLKQYNFTTDQKIKIYYTNSMIQWMGVFLVLGIWIFNGRSLSDIGFNPGKYDSLVWVLVVIASVAYLGDMFLQLQTKTSREKTIAKLTSDVSFMPNDWKTFKVFTLVALTAGVCEEIIFRGFMVNYVNSLFGQNPMGKYTAILLPAIIFGILHLYQGHRSVLKIIVGGILFCMIYYLSGSLYLPMLIHFLIDLISSYVIMKLIEKS